MLAFLAEIPSLFLEITAVSIAQIVHTELLCLVNRLEEWRKCCSGRKFKGTVGGAVEITVILHLYLRTY